MSNYIADPADLKKFLTERGWNFLGDQDDDGSVDSDEQSLLVLSAVEYASNLIDSYICSQINVATARASGNAWLYDRCMDIAVWRLACTGVREAPQSAVDALNLTKQLLEGVQDGALIPGYVYPSPVNAQYRTRRPIVSNP